jgi:cytidine deaminase
MNKEDLIKLAISASERAITFKSKVGAAILTRDGNVFSGFNIETYIHKGYHAEEVALISALKAGYKKTDFDSIAIAYSFPGVYPACSSCRQFLWEFTHPDLKVICFEITNNSGSEVVLKDLYPLPYPDWSKIQDKRLGWETEPDKSSVDSTKQGSVS